MLLRKIVLTDEEVAVTEAALKLWLRLDLAEPDADEEHLQRDARSALKSLRLSGPARKSDHRRKEV